MKGKIRVFCRLRPLNEKEISEGEKNIVASLDEFTLAHPWKDEKSKQHIYDRVFNQSASQNEVFEDTKVTCFLKLNLILYFDIHSTNKLLFMIKNHPCRHFLPMDLTFYLLINV